MYYGLYTTSFTYAKLLMMIGKIPTERKQDQDWPISRFTGTAVQETTVKST